uniref:Uncharacterized protein LOC105067248 n=1 Tax=Camelus bactrianus TaxID=9837 RepID=A0A9W3HHB1_CAMBA|nr:uncharacterized protein LOC105067248 [Camelus bactrianus]
MAAVPESLATQTLLSPGLHGPLTGQGATSGVRRKRGPPPLSRANRFTQRTPSPPRRQREGGVTGAHAPTIPPLTLTAARRLHTASPLSPCLSSRVPCVPPGMEATSRNSETVSWWLAPGMKTAEREGGELVLQYTCECQFREGRGCILFICVSPAPNTRRPGKKDGRHQSSPQEMLPLTNGLERVELPRSTFELGLHRLKMVMRGGDAILMLAVEVPSPCGKLPVLETMKKVGSSKGNKGHPRR